MSLPGQVDFQLVEEGDIQNHPFPGSKYPGASWIDVDHDGQLELLIDDGYLYQQKDGVFKQIEINLPQHPKASNSASTWGDMDLDGDMDLFVSGPIARLFENLGHFQFRHKKVVEDSTLSCWSASWGDFDNDGDLDLFCANPGAFFGNTESNFLLENQFPGGFRRVFPHITSTEKSTFTIPVWEDFDLDGDLDLVIGSGPADGSLDLDYIFRNNLSEKGKPSFTRITAGALFGGARDGQQWSWIDYDNDGDLDAYICNYNASTPNDLFRNNHGTFQSVSDKRTGTITTFVGNQLGAVWQDFDNNGWIDAYLFSDGNSPNQLFLNFSGGTFTKIHAGISGISDTRSVTSGDYNNDGFMDLYILSNTAAKKGLFRNLGNDNHWININLTNYMGNISPINSKVSIKINCGKKSMWQQRSLNSQSVFNGHNEYRIHFGLGAAEVVDSLVIDWHPHEMALNGRSQSVFTKLASNKFYQAQYFENDTIFVEGIWELDRQKPPSNSSIKNSWQLFRNPSDKKVTIKILDSKQKTCLFQIMDQKGRIIKEHIVVNDQMDLDLEEFSKGWYICMLSQENSVHGKKFFIQ